MSSYRYLEPDLEPDQLTQLHPNLQVQNVHLLPSFLPGHSWFSKATSLSKICAQIEQQVIFWTGYHKQDF